jgi:hypothetical protein
MTDSSYNGWKNYPTWAVNLWLSNEQGTYNECSYMAREALRDAPHDENVKPFQRLDGSTSEPIWTLEQTTRYRLADTMKEYVESLVCSSDDPHDHQGETCPIHEAGLGSDLLGYALGEVDWNEIADSWIESAKEEESYA